MIFYCSTFLIQFYKNLIVFFIGSSFPDTGEVGIGVGIGVDPLMPAKNKCGYEYVYLSVFLYLSPARTPHTAHHTPHRCKMHREISELSVSSFLLPPFVLCGRDYMFSSISLRLWYQSCPGTNCGNPSAPAELPTGGLGPKEGPPAQPATKVRPATALVVLNM